MREDLPIYHVFEIESDGVYTHPYSGSYNIYGSLKFLFNVNLSEIIGNPENLNSRDNDGYIRFSVPMYGELVDEDSPQYNEKWKDIFLNSCLRKRNYFITSVTGRNKHDFTPEIYSGAGNRDFTTVGQTNGNEVLFNGFVPHFHGWLTAMEPDEDVYNITCSDFKAISNTGYTDTYYNNNKRLATNNSITEEKGASFSTILRNIMISSLAPTELESGYSVYSDSKYSGSVSKSWNTMGVNLPNFNGLKTLAISPVPFVSKAGVNDIVLPEDITFEKGDNIFDKFKKITSLVNLECIPDVLICDIGERYIMHLLVIPTNTSINVNRKIEDGLLRFNMLHDDFFNSCASVDYDNDTYLSSYHGVYNMNLPFPKHKSISTRIEKDEVTSLNQAIDKHKGVVKTELRLSKNKYLQVEFTPDEDLVENDFLIIGDILNIRIKTIPLVFKTKVISKFMMITPDEDVDIMNETNRVTYSYVLETLEVREVNR